MALPASFHPEAEVDLAEGVVWYDRKHAGLGLVFAAAVREAERRSWEELARTGFVLGEYWSADSRFLHFHTMPPRIEFFRVDVRSRKIERLGELQDRWVFGIAWPWMGVTPEGLPLFLRDQSIHHLYALDLAP